MRVSEGFFQNSINLIFGYFNSINIFFDNKINNFRADLSDILVEKATLVRVVAADEVNARIRVLHCICMHLKCMRWDQIPRLRNVMEDTVAARRILVFLLGGASI